MPRLAALLASAALAAVLAAGCGGDDDGLAEAPEPAPAPGEAALTVTVQPRGPDGPSRTAEVVCPPEAPNAEAEEACEAIDEIDPGDADPVPPDAACTQIYGGPDIVELQGTLHGAHIDTQLTRENGCEINRFEDFRPLLEALFPGYEPGQAIRP